MSACEREGVRDVVESNRDRDVVVCVFDVCMCARVCVCIQCVCVCMWIFEGERGRHQTKRQVCTLTVSSV